MINDNWLISKSYKTGFSNHSRLLEKLNYENQNIYCGLNVLDSYMLTDRKQCIREKEQLFDDFVNQTPNISGITSAVPLQGIADGCKKYLLSSGHGGISDTAMNLGEVIAYGTEHLTGQELATFKCLFATLYLSSLCSHIVSPPLRLSSMQFTPEKLKFISKSIPSLQSMLEERCFGSTDSEDCFVWFEVKNKNDVLFLMETGNAHIILSDNADGIEDYDFYINIADEACAVHDRKNQLDRCRRGKDSVPIGENTFVPLNDDILKELQL